MNKITTLQELNCLRMTYVPNPGETQKRTVLFSDLYDA